MRGGVVNTSDLERGLQRIGAWNGRSSTGRCPVHGDDKPSLSIRRTTDGRIVAYCHSCAPRGPEAQTEWFRALVEAALRGEPLPPPTRTYSSTGSGHPTGELIAEYVYPAGTRKFLKQKFEGGDYRLHRWVHGAWAPGLGIGTRIEHLPPYGVDTLDLPGPLYWVEGEKDAARAHALGLAALTSAAGAHGPLPGWCPSLEGRDVYVVADGDLPGYSYAERVADYVRAHGATTVTLFRAAVDHKGADLSDHLDAGYSLSDLIPFEG